jgi:transposase
VHVTETCDEDSPAIITHVETSLATTVDQAVVEPIHQALADKQLLPAEHLVDAGYMAAGNLVSSQDEHQVDLLGPVQVDHSWQARQGLGFEVACFAIDWEQRLVTCPQGKTSQKWSVTQQGADQPVIQVQFAAQDCLSCPARALCTQAQAGPRRLKLLPQAEYLALQHARQRQSTAEFKQQYADRAGIEGTLSQGIRVANLRHCRYIGQAKTHLQHILTAAAINVTRVVNWLAEQPRAQTRVSRFAALAPT